MDIHSTNQYLKALQQRYLQARSKKEKSSILEKCAEILIRIGGYVISPRWQDLSFLFPTHRNSQSSFIPILKEKVSMFFTILIELFNYLYVMLAVLGEPIHPAFSKPAESIQTGSNLPVTESALR